MTTTSQKGKTDTIEKHEKFTRTNLIKKFKEAIAKERKKSDEEFDLQHSLAKFINQLKVSPQTRRTYLNWMLGTMARDVRWRRIDTHHLLRQGLEFTRIYKSAQMTAPVQSPPATIGLLASGDEPWRSLAVAGFCLCCRLGDLAKNVRTLELSDGKLSICLQFHKTVGIVGAKRIFAPLPQVRLDLPGRVIRALDEQTVLAGIKNYLKIRGLKPHSLRRGGIQHYITLGWSEEQIRSVSLHLSSKNFMKYM